MKTLNKTRYIPTGYELIKETPNTSIFGCENKPGHFVAMGFIRKSTKPAFHYGFKKQEDMLSHVDTFSGNVESNIEARAVSVAKRKEREAKEMQEVQVGDLFAYSWGYDQTNVEFFEVIEKKAKSFVMKEIASATVSNDAGGPMSADVVAVPGGFLKDAKPVLKTSFNMPHGVLSKTTAGKKHYSSWYA